MEEASNGVRASVVDQANLPAIWGAVSELLAPACERSQGQDTIQTLRASLMQGREGLFVVRDGDYIIGAVTYQTTDYDTGLRLLDINYAGGVAMGTQMSAVIDMFHTLKSALMCDRVRITGRKGWVRYMKQFGFKPTHYSVEME
jgi:hypothetical protein